MPLERKERILNLIEEMVKEIKSHWIKRWWDMFLMWW